MTCPHCQARNSPAALYCHNCQADLREQFEETQRAASTWSDRAKAWSVPALSAFVLIMAARGGGWLGDWYVRQLPTAPVPTATPGPSPISYPTARTSPTRLPSIQLAEWRPVLPVGQPDDLTRAAIAERYERWKEAHSRPVEEMTALYAPDAYVSFVPNSNVEGLRQVAANVRQNKMYGRAEDVAAPVITGSASRVGILAQNLHHHGDGSTARSRRALTWASRSGQWLIVRDELSLGESLMTRSATRPGMSYWPHHLAKQPDASTRTQIEQRYEHWKRAHSLSGAALMSLYAPDAYVNSVHGAPVNGTAGMRARVSAVQDEGAFSSAQDTRPIKMSQVGSRVLVATNTRYEYIRRPYSIRFGAGRDLIWEKRKGQWVIVVDHTSSLSHGGSPPPGFFPDRRSEPLAPSPYAAPQVLGGDAAHLDSSR